MCGIAGAFSNASNGSELVERMLTGLEHRGPDGRGLYADDLGALGHARLAIHDLSARATQPLLSRDQNLVLAINGTLHNAPELKQTKACRDYPYTSRSDSEVLFPLWEAHGLKCLEMLRGPFAFALILRRERKCLLARDALGQRPLFWTSFASTNDQGFAFASEVRALAQLEAKHAIDARAVQGFLQFGFLQEGESGLNSIRSVPAGSYLWADFDRPGAKQTPQITEVRWRPPPKVGAPRSGRDQESTFLEALEESVRLRTRTERSLGVLLSGGLDSATIAELALRVRATDQPPLQSFSLGFAQAEAFDERGQAEATARALGISHQSFAFDVEPGELLTEIIGSTGELLGDASLLPTTLLCRKARPYAVCLLGGDGGDELLLGYRRHRVAALAAKLSPRMARGLKALLSPALAKSIQGGRALGVLAQAAAQARASAEQPESLARLHYALSASLSLLPLDLQKVSDTEQDPLVANLRTHPTAYPKHPTAQAAFLDLLTYLPQDLMVKSDRAAMLSGAELWCPFLDSKVVAEGLALPQSQRLGLRRGKAPLRRRIDANSKLPKALKWRPKKGFGAPLAQWMNHGSYGLFCRNLLQDAPPGLRPMLGGLEPLEVLDRVQAGEPQFAALTHALVVLTLWRRVVLGP